MNKLHNMRKSKGLTQTEVAIAVGVKPNTISQYELGKRTPNIHLLKKIAKVLDCKIEDLI